MIILKADVSEFFKDVSEEKDIRLEIQIVIVSEILEVEFFPDPQCVFVISFADVRIIQNGIKRFSRWQLCLPESLKRIHVVIWINTFSRE